MNSRKTLTCNLFHLPQDIFRVIFQFLSAYELMKGEDAFLNNQELLSLYQSSLKGFTLTEIVTNHHPICWIIDRKLLVETLELCFLRNLEMDLLNHIRSSLKTIDFLRLTDNSYNSITATPPLGHFPSLITARFSGSNYFTIDRLLTFFSHNPQLEIVKIKEMHQLSNEILPHLSNSCPNIRILSLPNLGWVNDETISLLTQQTLFSNLKSLDIRNTEITNQESVRRFIRSRPLLCGLYLPTEIHYSDEFLLFYLRQVIFPSILSQNNHNDLESHSLAVTSLNYYVKRGKLYGRYHVVNPEIFSVDILSHFYRTDFLRRNLNNLTRIFYHLSELPSMIDSILQSQFIPFILNYMSPDDIFPTHYLGDILFRCGVFHDSFPLLVDIYRTHPSPLIEIFYVAVRDHFSLLTTEELQIIIPIVMIELPDKGSTYSRRYLISKLLQEPSSQLFFDPKSLMSFLLKLIPFWKYYSEGVIECWEGFICVNENFQQVFIESNVLSHIITSVGAYKLLNFTNRCLLSSQDGLLVDHLVDSGMFQRLLSNYSRFFTEDKNTMAYLLKLLITKNNKYSEMVKEMKLPDELRVKLFEKKEEN